MPSCPEIKALFAPYVDGESTALDRAAVEAHVGVCPPCRDALACEQACRDVLRARRGALHEPAPAPLRTRCAAAGASSPAAAPRRWVPLSVAATLVLAVGAALIYNLYAPAEALATQLTLDHVKCFRVGPGAAPAGDPAAAPLPALLEDRWRRQEGWGIQVPASWPAGGIALIGVRKCLSSEGSVAHVMYSCRGEPLSLYVLRGSLRADGLLETLGHRAIIWSGADRTYVVLGNEPEPELRRIAAYVRQTTESR